MYRLFIAIDLPEHFKEKLNTLCYGIPGAKWIKNNQFHLTIRFIGEVDGTRFKEIKEDLIMTRVNSFSLSLKEIGFFPPKGNPKVLWVGIKKNEDIMRLRNKIENRLVRIGVEPEKRKFHPHITLARLKETPASRVAGYIIEYNLFESEPFLVKEFFLYSSRLHANQAIHTREALYCLTDKKEDQ